MLASQICIGSTCGLWTVIANGERKAGHLNWVCRCECGTEKLVDVYNLVRGLSRSCGCLKVKEPSNLIHGLHGSVIYGLWRGMLQRCYLKTNLTFRRCGGRGIRVCEFLRASPANLLMLIGERPSPKLSVGRINNDGHYSCGACAECLQKTWPLNVRWETDTQQARNRSTNRLLTHDGQTKSLAQWAEDSGISYWTLKYRANHGLDPFIKHK